VALFFLVHDRFGVLRRNTLGSAAVVINRRFDGLSCYLPVPLLGLWSLPSAGRRLAERRGYTAATSIVVAIAAALAIAAVVPVAAAAAADAAGDTKVARAQQLVVNIRRTGYEQPKSVG